MKRKALRQGYTTGACAAAAAKGAALMLRNRLQMEEVQITLPSGEEAVFRLHGQVIGENLATCFVIKDAGDDPDVTNGAEIYATVMLKRFSPSPPPSPTRGEGAISEMPAPVSGEYEPDNTFIVPSEANESDSTPPPLLGGGKGEGWPVVIEGGTGIGRVTKPGLALPVGEWAINPVPRRMITEAVNDVFAPDCPLSTAHCPLLIPHVIVSIPNGEELAKKTLNARLGIIGGLSILGTTGIVRPVSADAWTDTIEAAIDVALACGCSTIVLSTGRTSEKAAERFFSRDVTTTKPPYQQSPPPLTGGGRGVGEEGKAVCNVGAAFMTSDGCAMNHGAIKQGAMNRAPTGMLMSEESFIMMGDHVGFAIRACARKGVKSLVLAGQFAKLLKIACGHEQTHVASSRLDLQTLADWLKCTRHVSRLTSHVLRSLTAREILESSGNNPELISLVCGRAAQFAGKLAPSLSVKVFLAGYGGEVLYYGPDSR
jgi:cobalt-precorrin-5B (C1)-methyltransferase